MNNEEIKRIIVDEQVDRLTAQVCHHWVVASRRMEELAEELDGNMDTNIEAEVYAVMMRLQRVVMAMLDLNTKPSTYLFSKYVNSISETLTSVSINRPLMALVKKLLNGKIDKSRVDFLDYVAKSFAHHNSLSEEKQKEIEQKVAPLNQVLSVCAQYVNPADLMMLVNIMEQINEGDDVADQDEIGTMLKKMCKDTDELAKMMDSNLQTIMIWLMLLVIMPGMLLNMIKDKRKDSKKMAILFNKVLERVRQSNEWWEYWKEHRETLKVVSDSCSWNDIMVKERSKQREELGKTPGGLFAKWTNDREAFADDFLDAKLSDDDLHHFIFHLVSLYEIARELNPTGSYGKEQLVNNDQHQVADAVMEAAQKLDNLVTERWFPYYDDMWKEIVADEDIFSRLKVTRKSPHNNKFTAISFCRLVGEMKKSAVFGPHSDNDLAVKLVDSKSVGTFRKNIQEGIEKEPQIIQEKFDAILLKYRKLVKQ